MASLLPYGRAVRLHPHTPVIRAIPGRVDNHVALGHI
jgi:hypothetical protein